MKQCNWKFPAILLLVLISGGCYSREAAKSEVLHDVVQSSAVEATMIETEVAETIAMHYVHICGAVLNPGVYQVSSEERVFRVLELAGGYTEDAATDYLNLAEQVTDGSKLVVPTIEEFDQMKELLMAAPESLAAMAEGTGKVELNSATKEQLMQLTGVGEARAAAIIKYREQYGSFEQIEDLMKVPGIKQGAFDKLKDDIIVLK